MLGWFRRHATVLMVFLGSAAMVIFGLGPVFDQLSQGGGSSRVYENKTLAAWKGGDISESDIAVLKQRHFETQRLLAEIAKQAEKRMDNYRPLAPMLPSINDFDAESQMLERIMYAEKAKAEGFVASDAMVENYIGLLSADAGFTEQDLVAMNQRVNQSPLLVVLEHLKTELLYAQMMDYLFERFAPAIPNVTEGMELYRRTNEQIECVVVPVEIDPFVSQVSGSPSSAEMKRLYEEGKNKYPDPTGEEPGFKVLRRANIQYVMADFETFLQNEMNKLTEEQVQQEYDRLVAEKSFLVTEPVTADNSFQVETPPPTAPEGGESPEKGDTPATDKPDDVDAPPVDPNAEKPAGGNADDPQTDPNKEGQDGEANSSEKKSDEGTAKPGEETKKSEGNGDQSQRTDDVKYQFVSTGLQENDPPKADPQGTKQADPQDAKQAEKAQKQESGEAKPATQEKPEKDSDAKPSGEQQPAKTNSDAKQGEDPDAPQPPPGDESAQENVADALQLEDQKPTEQEPKFKPLKDVVGQIKRQMAMEPARKAMEDKLLKASVEVRNYYANRLEWEVEKTGDEPAPLDYEAIAESYDLQPGESGMVNREEFRDNLLGGIPLQTANVSDAIFGQFDRKQLFEPEQFGGAFSIPNQFLFWYAEKEEARVPSFKECEDEIIKFWKQREARKLALAEAESMAKKANDSQDKSLTDLYPERATPTGAFTWLNTRFGSQISDVIGVNNAGDEFMEIAFSLEKGEVGFAINQTNDKVYLIQSMTGTRPVSETGKEYLENQFMTFKAVPPAVGQAAGYYQRSSQRKLAESLRDELGLERLD